MRENNPFDDTGTGKDIPKSADQASANAMNALNEPKKSGFLSNLKNRKKTAEPTPAADSQPTSASDFSSSDTAYSPLINENEPQIPTEAQFTDSNQEKPTSANEASTNTFQRKPPVAIDGVSPDYSAQPTTSQPTSTQYEATTPAPRYEDFQPVEQQPYTPPQEQPMIYQQPYQQDYYQQQPTDPYTANNQPLPVNYNTTPNIYDPYNPYAEMVDLNPGARDPNKKPDWKFIITLSAAIICFATTIFFFIGYSSASNSVKANEAEILELESKTSSDSKDLLKIEDLENTVRDLTEKNTTLIESNDELKKNEDKLKELETTNTTLQEDKQSWQDKYYDVLTRCGEKCASSSSRSD